MTLNGSLLPRGLAERLDHCVAFVFEQTAHDQGSRGPHQIQQPPRRSDQDRAGQIGGDNVRGGKDDL